MMHYLLEVKPGWQVTFYNSPLKKIKQLNSGLKNSELRNLYFVYQFVISGYLLVTIYFLFLPHKANIGFNT